MASTIEVYISNYFRQFLVWLELAEKRVYSLIPGESSTKLIILGALLLTMLVLLFLTLLLLARTINISGQKKSELLIKECDEILMELLETGSISGNACQACQRISKSKGLKRQLFLQQILTLHAHFTGEFAEIIRQLYLSTGLVNDSLSKLEDRRWFIKCRGIREARQMLVAESVPVLTVLSRDSNPTVKHEAQLALLSILGFEGLDFLSNDAIVINDWQQINIIAILSKPGTSLRPDFSKWLYTESESVTRLALQLIIRFRQTQSVPCLKKLFYSGSKASRLLALKAMQECYNNAILDELIAVFDFQERETREAIIDTLNALGAEKEAEWLMNKTIVTPDSTAGRNSDNLTRSIKSGYFSALSTQQNVEHKTCA